MSRMATNASVRAQTTSGSEVVVLSQHDRAKAGHVQ
jgi:hypothetical protein